jgi:hypothetical protein
MTIHDQDLTQAKPLGTTTGDNINPLSAKAPGNWTPGTRMKLLPWLAVGAVVMFIGLIFGVL